MSADVEGLADEHRSEQQYFDDAHEVREEKRRVRLEGATAAGDAKAATRLASGGDGLGRPGDEVAFAKVTTTDGQCFYVGKHDISLGGDTRVYSWKVPGIMKMREATVLEPRGVERQRQFRTEGNTILSFEDQVFEEIARELERADDPDTEVIRGDVMLDDELSRDRSPQMREIAQTIQALQSRIIRTPLDRLLVIQGGPGTGKTAVALHRVSYLLHRYLGDLSPSDVLVIGPNRTFVRYINRVLPELGDEQVRQADLIGMLESPVSPRGKEEPAVAALKGDARLAEVLSRALAQRVKASAGSITFESAGVASQRARTIVQPAEVVQCFRGLVADPYTPYSTGRKQFRDRLIELVERKLADSVRTSGRALVGKVPTVELGPVDALVERTWPQLSPQAFVRSMLGSRERMQAASAGVFSDQETALLYRAPMQRLADEPWSKEDLVLIDTARSLIDGLPRAYRHIVVDEAQDLSPMQLLALRRRSADGSMTVVGDIAQSTGHWARSSWDEVRTLLSTEVEVVDGDLPHGYRVPRSVMDLAAKLLPKAAPGITAPIVIRDVEPGPQLVPVSVDGSFFGVAVQTIRDQSSLGRFVGVVCPDGRVEGLGRALDAARISYRNADDGGLGTSITVVSPVAAKGLEFDAVVVIDPQAIVEGGPQGYRMLYIALTRTTKHLDIVYPEGSLPEPIRPEVEPPAVGAARAPVVPSEPDESKVEPAPPASNPEPPANDRGQHVVAPPQPGRLATSAHQRLLDMHVAVLLEHLDDTVAPKMWHDVLVEALRQVDEDDG